MQEISLSTLFNGHLEKEFQSYVPAAVKSALDTKKIAKLNIIVVFEPDDELPDAFTMRAKVRASLPSVEKGRLCKWEDGKVVMPNDDGDGTMALPFTDDVNLESEAGGDE